jgi:predicted SAM-dependent methyltransferase
MTKDDILSMAKQACQEGDSPFVSGWITMDHNEFERFADLVAEKEREKFFTPEEADAALNHTDFSYHNAVTQEMVDKLEDIIQRGKSDKQD